MKLIIDAIKEIANYLIRYIATGCIFGLFAAVFPRHYIFFGWCDHYRFCFNTGTLEKSRMA